MDNVVLTSATQISPNAGHPLHVEPSIDALVATPLEPQEENNVDGNFQAHFDVNYQAHDVALATAEKSNGHAQTNGFKQSEDHKMEIDDSYEHPDKANSSCALLNKLFLALAIVCFALLLCSIAFIVTYLGWWDSKNDGRVPLQMSSHQCQLIDPFNSREQSLIEPFFNLTHPNGDGIIVVLARRGASIENIFLPYRDQNGMKQYRSIVLKGNEENSFGSVRFGFDEEINSMNLTQQLPLDYPFYKSHQQMWTMFADVNKPFRARFIDGFVEIIYEFSSSNKNEFTMTTIVSPPVGQQLVADPTNNIFFNLRGQGNLQTHFLNVTSSTAINMKTGEKLEQNQFVQGQSVDQMNNVRNFFYKVDRAGLGKNFVGTLTEIETKTTMNIFADHFGLVIDPTGLSRGNVSGIRISPRQSPSFQPRSIYGPTLVIAPSQAIHTTWWQFDY